MSIFKGTLKPFVAAQLKAREKIVSQTEGNTVGTAVRDANFLRFTTGKNGWVRMISMVDYDSQVFKNGKWQSDGRYTGNQLSKKYILEGGTLFNDRLRRAGVNQADSTYGSNLDRVSSNPKDTRIDRTFGIRPMPGITSVSVQNKSAYGSLREATINFYAWDKHQLEELEILFMRPGYTVWLDWGWSQYLNHGPAKQGINSYPDDIRIENFNIPTPNVFDSFTEDTFYNSIDLAVEKSKGNYDAMLGYIKNFSWQLLPNGGYQCSTTLISRGEVIESIKASANPRTVIGSKPPAPSTVLNTDSPEEPRPVLSFFEKIFLTLKATINTSELTDLGNPPPSQSQDNVNNTAITGSTPQQGPTGEFYAQGTDVTKVKAEIQDKWESIKQGLQEETTLYKAYNSKGEIQVQKGFNVPDPIGGVLPTEGTADGSGIEYISMNTFIAILQRFLIPTNEKTNEPVVYIVIPYTTPCLMSEDTVSVDPTTCLIRNQFATFIMDNSDETDQKKIGFQPILYTNFDYSGSTFVPGAEKIVPSFPNETIIEGSKPKTATIPAPTASEPNKTEEITYSIINIGEIGNIYISIGKIIETYRKLSDENGVDVVELLQNILNDISFALGGINDFKLYTEKNIVQIIDAKYLEQGAPASSKFNLDLIGLRSICRDVKINSRIFEEQSTMIAIGAAGSGNNNLGDVYSSTQTLLNKGLKDRVLRDVKFKENSQNPSGFLTNEDLYYLDIYNNIKSLTTYLKRKVIGDNKKGYNVITAPQDNEIANASSLLKTLHYQLNGKDTDFKALIPFELEITLDGISGFVIGEIITIKKDFLPKEYYNKNIGFVITGVSHLLQNNDWTTTLKTQICLLENDNYPASVDKFKLKKKLENIKNQAEANSYIAYAMTDYAMYLFVRILSEQPKEKTTFKAGTTQSISKGGLQAKYLDPTEEVNIRIAVNHLSETDGGKFGYGGGKGNAGYGFGGSWNSTNGGYIKQWWETNKSNTALKNFPTSSFDEFLTLRKTDGEIIPPAVMGVTLINFNKWLLNFDKVKGTYLEINNFTDFKKEEDFFLYRIFGPNPKAFLEQNNLISKTIKTETVLSNAKEAGFVEKREEINVINLKGVWIYLLKEIQAWINVQPTVGPLIQANENHVSLEVDVTKPSDEVKIIK